MKWFSTLFTLLAFLHCSLGLAQDVYANNRYQNLSIVVDIAPIHDLVQQLTQGLVVPERLLTTKQSPHHMQLAPSQISKISKAKIIIMVGDGFAPELDEVVGNIGKNAQVIKLLKLADVTYLPYRNLDGAGEHLHIAEPTDPHFWLDPVLMKQVMTSLANTLIVYFPKDQETFKNNLKKVQNSLDALNTQIGKELADIPNPNAAPFTTYHDAYQYFENRYKITPLLPLLRTPLSAVGTKSQLTRMEDVARMKLRCILTEENVPLVARVAEASKAEIKLINTEAGLINAADKAPYSYTHLMLSVTDTIKTCSTPR